MWKCDYGYIQYDPIIIRYWGALELELSGSRVPDISCGQGVFKCVDGQGVSVGESPMAYVWPGLISDTCSVMITLNFRPLVEPEAEWVLTRVLHEAGTADDRDVRGQGQLSWTADLPANSPACSVLFSPCSTHFSHLFFPTFPSMFPGKIPTFPSKLPQFLPVFFQHQEWGLHCLDFTCTRVCPELFPWVYFLDLYQHLLRYCCHLHFCSMGAVSLLSGKPSFTIL